jgi:hypothetical protein
MKATNEFTAPSMRMILPRNCMVKMDGRWGKMIDLLVRLPRKPCDHTQRMPNRDPSCHVQSDLDGFKAQLSACGIARLGLSTHASLALRSSRSPAAQFECTKDSRPPMRPHSRWRFLAAQSYIRSLWVGEVRELMYRSSPDTFQFRTTMATPSSVRHQSYSSTRLHSRPGRSKSYLVIKARP